MRQIGQLGEEKREDGQQSGILGVDSVCEGAMPSVPRRMGLRESFERAGKPGRGGSCHHKKCFRKERGYELGGGKGNGDDARSQTKRHQSKLVARQTPGICPGGLLLGRRTRAMLRDWALAIRVPVE
jgi:hypothetical protein